MRGNGRIPHAAHMYSGMISPSAFSSSSSSRISPRNFASQAVSSAHVLAAGSAHTSAADVAPLASTLAPVSALPYPSIFPTLSPSPVQVSAADPMNQSGRKRSRGEESETRSFTRKRSKRGESFSEESLPNGVRRGRGRGSESEAGDERVEGEKGERREEEGRESFSVPHLSGEREDEGERDRGEEREGERAGMTWDTEWDHLPASMLAGRREGEGEGEGREEEVRSEDKNEGEKGEKVEKVEEEERHIKKRGKRKGTSISWLEARATNLLLTTLIALGSFLTSHYFSLYISNLLFSFSCSYLSVVETISLAFPLRIPLLFQSDANRKRLLSERRCPATKQMSTDVPFRCPSRTRISFFLFLARHKHLRACHTHTPYHFAYIHASHALSTLMYSLQQPQTPSAKESMQWKTFTIDSRHLSFPSFLPSFFLYFKIPPSFSRSLIIVISLPFLLLSLSSFSQLPPTHETVYFANGIRIARTH